MPTKGVLVVDDMEDARLVMSHIAHSLGWPIFEATTGREALELVEENKTIDTVFVDISLPDMSGFEVIRRLAPLKGERRLRLCALTGLRGEEAREKALRAGADHFIEKPLHPRTLMKQIFALGT